MRRKVLARSVRTVVEQLESRTLLSAAPVVAGHALAYAKSHLTKDVTNVGTGTDSIFGTFYQDLNGNGQQDPNEPVVVGGTVYLDINNDGTLDAGDIQTKTDSAGGFGFTNIADGTYVVRIVPDPGFHQPAPGFVSVAVFGGAQQIVEIGEVDVTVASSTTVSGVVFDDVNQDGIYDPVNEGFLADDTVYVDLNQNGVLDPGEPSTVTNNTGGYSFTLAAGTYQLRVVPRPGFHQDPPGFYLITLVNGDQDIANIGENNTSTITGHVFTDLNGNGILDPGEPVVANETVFLDEDFDGVNSMGTPNLTTGGFDNGDPFVMTDSTGLYTFTDLSPGLYRIRITPTDPTVFQDGPGFVDVTITQGQLVNVDLGEGAGATVTGTVFNDVNGNGTLDAGEAGVPNQLVYTDLNDNGIFDALGNAPDGTPYGGPETNTMTDAGGNYSIPDLGPGTYILRTQFPNASDPTAPATPGNAYTLTLTPGEVLTSQNFGFKIGNLSISLVQFPTHDTLAGRLQHAVVKITNEGNATSTGIDSINIFDSTSAAIDPGTAGLIGYQRGVALKLRPGASKVFSVPFAFPIATPTAAYFVAAQVVSTVGQPNVVNELSNVIGPTNVGQPFIDLAVAYAAQPPVEVDPGQGTSLSIVVTNFGNVANNGVLTFRTYTTTSNVFDPTDTVVNQFQVKGVSIRPGKSRLFTIPLRSPGITLGNRYVIVTLDSGDALGEYNLNNNIAISLAPTSFQ